VSSYYLVILLATLANLALAAVALVQRAKQIRGNKLRERQVQLAETRNELAEERLRNMRDQIVILSEIRDTLCTRPGPQASVGQGQGPIVGVIDVGSATIRLRAGTYGADGVFSKICDERAYMQLAEDIERIGCYSELTLRRVQAVVERLAGLADDVGCERLAIVVTAPGRLGANPHELLHAVGAATRYRPQQLSAAEEARAAFFGATSTLGALDGQAVVCDVGGGSIEIAVGSISTGVEQTFSFELGAVTLAARHFRKETPATSELAAARAEALACVRLESPLSPGVVLAAGGSARALGKLVGGPTVDQEQLQAALARALSPKCGDIIKNKHRRHLLPAGIILLGVLQDQLDAPLAIASGGLREGILLHLSGHAPHWQDLRETMGLPRDNHSVVASPLR
jgi:exopolyphosphatase/guanosine-5'-triphosphate,3'-diphosphate pyrophosphatase